MKSDTAHTSPAAFSRIKHALLNPFRNRAIFLFGPFRPDERNASNRSARNFPETWDLCSLHFALFDNYTSPRDYPLNERLCFIIAFNCQVNYYTESGIENCFLSSLETSFFFSSQIVISDTCSYCARYHVLPSNKPWLIRSFLPFISQYCTAWLQRGRNTIMNLLFRRPAGPTIASGKSTASGITRDVTADILTVRISAARECLSRGCGHISARSTAAWRANTLIHGRTHTGNAKLITHSILELARLLLTPSAAFRE